jgi:hypothetical protein
MKICIEASLDAHGDIVYKITKDKEILADNIYRLPVALNIIKSRIKKAFK